jgi:hypothetical protein
MIRNDERSGFQLRNRLKRSCGAGPSHWPLASTLPDVVDEIATIKSGDAPTAEKYEYKGDCD